jgi:hypothetical protein
MCTVLLPPGVIPIEVLYIYIYHIVSNHIYTLPVFHIFCTQHLTIGFLKKAEDVFCELYTIV